MRYVWKFLSIISGMFLGLFAIPMIVITYIHIWLCKKANPKFDTLTSIVDSLKSNNKTQDAAMVEIIKSTNELIQKNTHTSAWETLPQNKESAIINPIIPRIATLPIKD